MRLLVSWAALYIVVTLTSAFLHQCGHGIGALVDDVHISSGVASAGDPYKKPSDADFRSQLPLTGRLSSTGILGPFTNWVLALLSVAALAKRRKADFLALFFAASAIGNGGIRIFPVSRFLLSTTHGKLFLDDEATWGLAANSGLQFPMTFDQLDGLMTTQPGLIASHPAVYFWPLISFLICTGALWQAYPMILKLYRDQLKTRAQLILFILMPFLVTPLILVSALFLDEHVRINW